MSKIPEGLKAGDRVRVVIEDEVVSTANAWTQLKSRGIWVHDRDSAIVSVEKLDPPVEVFRPGDRLRRKGGLDYEVTLADEGYLQHSVVGSTGYHAYGSTLREWFNSENFDKIEFIQPPF